MQSDIEELKLLIIHNLDIQEFLDLLDIDLVELVEILEEQIEEQYSRLHAAVR